MKTVGACSSLGRVNDAGGNQSELYMPHVNDHRQMSPSEGRPAGNLGMNLRTLVAAMARAEPLLEDGQATRSRGRQDVVERGIKQENQ
jgi:hypothetical protein